MKSLLLSALLIWLSKLNIAHSQFGKCLKMLKKIFN